MTEKVLGYLLIFLGILAIFLSAFSVYLVFTHKAEPYAFMQPGPIVFNLQLPADPSGSKMVNVPVDLSKVMPLAPITNIFLHLVLMGFIASAGAKLAGIGTNLVRPIVVKAKEG